MQRIMRLLAVALLTAIVALAGPQSNPRTALAAGCGMLSADVYTVKADDTEALFNIPACRRAEFAVAPGNYNLTITSAQPKSIVAVDVNVRSSDVFSYTLAGQPALGNTLDKTVDATNPIRMGSSLQLALNTKLGLNLPKASVAEIINFGTVAVMSVTVKLETVTPAASAAAPVPTPGTGYTIEQKEFELDAGETISPTLILNPGDGLSVEILTKSGELDYILQAKQGGDFALNGGSTRHTTLPEKIKAGGSVNIDFLDGAAMLTTMKASNTMTVLVKIYRAQQSVAGGTSPTATGPLPNTAGAGDDPTWIIVVSVLAILLAGFGLYSLLWPEPVKAHNH